MSGLSHITEHKEQMLARLLYQYKDKPNITKVITVLAARYQGLEDALWQLATLRSIELGEGEQLNVIGRIIGQTREDSANDAEYRLRLKARMRANQSSGTPEDILAVFAALLGGYSNLELTPYYPAGLLLRIDDTAITEALANLYADFLFDSKLGAVAAWLHTSPTDNENTFTFSMSTHLTADYDPGGTTMHVDTTEGFLESGYLVFLPGASDQWRLRYTYKTPTTFEGLSDREGTAVGQSSGSLVVQQTSPCSELSANVANPSVIAIALEDASPFPPSGYVSVGPLIADSTYRIFHYGAILGNVLRTVTDTGIGTATSFTTGQIVALISQCFGADGESFGGQFSSVMEAS